MGRQSAILKTILIIGAGLGLLGLAWALGGLPPATAAPLATAPVGRPVGAWDYLPYFGTYAVWAARMGATRQRAMTTTLRS